MTLINTAIIAGSANGIRCGQTNKNTDYISMRVSVPTGRTKDDGTPIAQNISVKAFGPMAKRLKELKDGAMVCVEGRFEPYKGQDSKISCSIAANVIQVADCGAMNSIKVLGRLTRDPEFRQTSSGKTVCNFSIANTRSIKKGDNWEDVTSFINCVAWEDACEALKALHKGDMVWVDGELSNRSWEKDGEKYYITEINAQKTTKGGSGKRNQTVSGDANAPSSAAATPAASGTGDFAMLDEEDAELPF